MKSIICLWIASMGITLSNLCSAFKKVYLQFYAKTVKIKLIARSMLTQVF